MARPKAATTRLDEALQASEAGKSKLAELHAARNKALLADDDVGALKLAAEIDLQEQTVRGITDKIELLKSEAEREAAERRAKERAVLIQKIEAKLVERDKIGAELADTIKRSDELFRRLFEIGKEVRAAWPWEHFHLAPALIGDQTILRAVEAEIFKCGGRPDIGGGMDRPKAPSYPGGKSPLVEFILQPDKIRPLIDVLKEASQHAGEIMRTGKAYGTTPIHNVPVPEGYGGEPRERTDAEQRLAKLLSEAYTASVDVSAAGEEKYMAIMAQVKAAQIEVDEFNALAAKGGR